MNKASTHENGEGSRREIMDFLRQFISEHGYSPSIREIVGGTGILSTSTVSFHLIKLQEQGKISFTPTLPRTVRVLDQ